MTVGKPFESGKSGNPGGRPKDPIRTLAREHGPAAIKRLVEWMGSDNPKASVSASQALLDRGYGKPLQQLMHTEVPLEGMLDQLDGKTPEDTGEIED